MKIDWVKTHQILKPYAYVFIKGLFLSCILIGPKLPLAEAFQIKQVYRLPVALAEDETELTVSLYGAVDWSRTLLLTQQSVSALADSTPEYRSVAFGGEGDAQIAAFPKDNGSVIVRRGLSFKPVHARVEAVVYAVEFRDGVKVQRGITRFDPEVYAKTIDIPTVDNHRAIPLIAILSSDPVTNQNEAFMFRVFFSGPDNLRIERGVLPSQGRKYAQLYADVYWQTIEFESGVRVRSGEAKLTNNKASMARVLPGLPLSDPNKAALFFSAMTKGKARGDETVLQLRGYIEGKETLRFSRARVGDKGKGVNLDLYWYVAEFDEGTQVHRGTLTFEEGEMQKEVEIAPVIVQDCLATVTSAAVLPDQQPVIESGVGTVPAMNQSSFHFISELIAPNKLRLTRMDSADIQEGRVQAEWQLIEFAPFHMLTPLPGEILHVQEPYDFIWSRSEGAAFDTGVAGAGTADFFLIYPSSAEHPEIPLALNIPLRENAFRMVLPTIIEKKKISGPQLRLRMRDQRKTAKTDLNPGYFAIKGRLRLLEPTGGTVWPRDGSKNVIRWEAIGITGDVAIYYDDQGGEHERAFGRKKFISKVAAGADPVVSYLWDDMPDLFSKKMRLKVVQVSDPTLYAISSADFAVYPVIRMTEPVFGEKTWEAHTVKRVAWETNGTIPSFNLQYRSAETQPWQNALENIAGGPAGSYSVAWEIPGDASGPQTQLRVVSAQEESIAGVFPREGEAFPIGPWLRLRELPPAGMQFKNLDQLEVRWDVAGSTTLIMIEYSTDGGQTWNKQAVAEANERVYRWTFMNFSAEQVLLRVSDLERPDVRDESEVPFRVISAG